MLFFTHSDFSSHVDVLEIFKLNSSATLDLWRVYKQCIFPIRNYLKIIKRFVGII